MNALDIHGANWKRRLLENARIKKAHLALGLKYFPETDNNGMAAEGDEKPKQEKENPYNLC